MRFEAYHTCELKKSNFLQAFEAAPVKASEGNQWLTHGYYFWSNCRETAKWWGKQQYLNKGKNFAITHFTMEIDEDDVLDFIANQDDYEEFFELAKEFYETGGKILEFSDGSKIMVDDFKDLTIEEIINYLRDLQIFPYKAVRACDRTHKTSRNFYFTTEDEESLVLTSKHQICIFALEDVLNFTIKKKAFSPSQYVNWFNGNKKRN